MSAETLRKAAALMRERAEAEASRDWEAVDFNDDPAGPLWGVANDAFFNPPSDDETPWLAVEVHTGHRATAEHIASWHPAVALAVADWLEAEAAEFEKLAVQSAAVNLLLEFADETFAARIGIGYNTLTQAIAVARAYLGEA